MVDVAAVRRGDVPLERADDPRGGRPVEPERVADGHHGVADADAVRVRKRKGSERAGGDVHLEEGEVGGGIRADQLRLVGVLVRERHLDLLRALDDVVVGDDVAGLVDDEAGAEGLLRGLLGLEAEERVDGRARRGGGGDLHDSR